jgi:hypothetical protein
MEMRDFWSRVKKLITAYNIATALGTSVEYLVTGNDGEAAERMRILVREFQEELARI